MTDVVGTRRAAPPTGHVSSDPAQDGELAALIRSWMAVGRPQGRGRRETVSTTSLQSPPLPRRPDGFELDQAIGVALLIDARHVSTEVATGLLALLSESSAVCAVRAYADWERPELAAWAGGLGRDGVHSFHQFSDDDDQALVAMSIDAVDIARDDSVDEVVIAGDLTSALPLVQRLHVAGVRVVGVGAAHTPRDVRAACHEFIDTATVDGHGVVASHGRHRA